MFGALVGTLALLAPADRARVAGLVVNRLRGDGAILRPGLDELHALTGRAGAGRGPVDRRAPRAVGGLARPRRTSTGDDTALVDIAVVRLPRLANFDDFEWLAAEPGVRVRWVRERRRRSPAPT